MNRLVLLCSSWSTKSTWKISRVVPVVAPFEVELPDAPFKCFPLQGCPLQSVELVATKTRWSLVHGAWSGAMRWYEVP